MIKESVQQFLNRGGKIISCKSGKAKGSKLNFTHSSAVFSSGRKKLTLRDANFYLKLSN